MSGEPVRTTRGFTLVELLVVAAIIALLLGLLLPALSGGMAAAQQTQSASNLRQLAVALHVHAHEHGDRLPAAAPEIQTRNLVRWHGAREEDGRPFEPEGGTLTPYLDSDTSSVGVRTCPGFAPTLDVLATDPTSGFERSCGGYGYNQDYLGVRRSQQKSGASLVLDDTVGARRSRVDRPTETVAFATSALAAERLIEYSFVRPPWWPQWPDFRPDPSIHFRFGGRALVAWLDGHVSVETRSFSEASGIYTLDPALFEIGWFGDVSSNAMFDYD